MPTTAVRHRDTIIGTATALAPPHIQALTVVTAYARTRCAAAWRDEQGLTKTVEVVIWLGIGLLAAIGIGAVLINALRDRATDIGDKVRNDPLP